MLLIGVKTGTGKKSQSTKTEEAASTEADVVKYEGYAQQIDSVFNDVYGYTYTITVQSSPDNAYFLDGIMKESVSDKAYNIDGTIVERGVDGHITSESMAEEDFVFTSKGSYLDAVLYEYIDSLPSDDPRKEYKGYESDIDLGYTVSGTEVLKNLSDTLINSRYTDENSNGSSFTVTYPEGALKANTGRKYFDRFINEYPGELKLTVRVENDENVTQVYIDGEGKIPFNIVLYELKTLSNYDSSLIDHAYNLKKIEEDPFNKEIEHITLDEYFKKYSK